MIKLYFLWRRNRSNNMFPFKIAILLNAVLLTGCSIFVIEHEEGNLPHIEINEARYVCPNGDVDVDVDRDEMVFTCKIKF